MEGRTGDELHVLDCFLNDMHQLDSKADTCTCTACEVAVSGSKRGQAERKRAPKRKRKNQYWFKRKQELYTLRQQTEELGTHVAYLQLRQEKQRDRLGISSARFAELSNCEVTERKRQEAALVENEALKTQVRKYSRILAKLRSKVAIAASEQSQQAEFAVSSGEELQSNVRLFTMLQARLNQRTSDLHILLREIREKRTCQDSYSMQMHDGWVEYSWSQVLPFHVLATVNALWGIVESGGSRRNLVSRVFGRSQDVYKITSRHALSNAAATVDSHSVIKRYFAPQNFVLVAESKSEHCGGAGAWRNTTEESVWCAVRQIPSRSTDDQVSVFQLKAVVRSQKYSSLDYAGNYVRDIIDIQRQYLENALLDSLRDGQTN